MNFICTFEGTYNITSNIHRRGVSLSGNLIGHAMEILDFVARSEWPLVALVAIAVFRKPLTRLLDRVRPTKVSAWGISVELDKVEVLTEETRAIAKEEAPKRLEKPRDDLLHFQVEEYDHPQLVILKAWTALEHAIYRASGKSALTPGMPPWLPVRTMESIFRELGLTTNEVDALRELRKIRNRVAHEIDFPVTRPDAIRFTDLSNDLITRLQLKKPPA
jgi:hypothetical protein